MAGSAQAETRTLSFFWTHTQETLTVTFKENGQFVPEGLAKLNAFLRDWRREQATKMDPNLFDILWEVYQASGSKEPIHIVSAYRSPETNGMLRSRSRGVAQFSQHTQGRAMDFRLPDVSITKIRELGLKMQAGGVGFYPGSNFVHLDTGSVRHWPRMTRMQLAKVFPDGKTIHVPSDGKPLPGYELAAAEVARSRSRLPSSLGRGGAIQTASADEGGVRSRGGKQGNFVTRLFSGGEDEAEENAETAPAVVAKAGTPPAPTVLASAQPLAPSPEPRPTMLAREPFGRASAGAAALPLPEARPVVASAEDHPARAEAIRLASSAPTLEARSDALRALITQASAGTRSEQQPSMALAMMPAAKPAAASMLGAASGLEAATASIGPKLASLTSSPKVVLPRAAVQESLASPGVRAAPENRLVIAGSVAYDPAFTELTLAREAGPDDLWAPVTSVIAIRFTRIEGVGPRTDTFQGPAVIPMPTAVFAASSRLKRAAYR